MSEKKTQVKMLEEAFKQFNATSSELEKSYHLLKTEVRRLKKELRESKREKEALREQAERNHRLAAVGEMAARTAHELRNPLGSIELFASLLQKEISKTSNDPEKTAWAGHLLSAVKSMDHSITNLLLFTRKPRPVFKETNLRALISDLLGFAAQLFKQHRIEVFHKIDRRLENISCDEDLLRQVLLNLILNAIDAMPGGGALKISAHTAHDTPEEIVISLSDTGSGIAETALPQIFDPFFTTKNTGSGLGLSIAQNAVTAHQGRIQVENRNGCGAIFSIYLPKHREGQHAQQTQ